MQGKAIHESARKAGNLHEKRPRIALTMGDAGGIGPEIIATVLASPPAAPFSPLVIGDLSVMQRGATVVSAPLEFRRIQLDELSAWSGEDDGLSAWSSEEIPVFSPPGTEVSDIGFGETDARAGAAAGACLTAAYELAQGGHIDGVVSAPLSKESFHSAGYKQIDELDYLGEFTTSEPFLVGIADGIWTVAITLHTPLRNVADMVTRQRVLEGIDVLAGVLQRSGAPGSPIAVAALNPHAGDNGLLGREEIDEIEPAIAEAREAGIDVVGPLPADTVFVRAFRGEFAGVVCMYHDQANIARKLRGFAGGATLFLGLPVICGTTAHGTAFEIAGRGEADPGSFAKALSLVIELAVPRDRRLRELVR